MLHKVPCTTTYDMSSSKGPFVLRRGIATVNSVSFVAFAILRLSVAYRVWCRSRDAWNVPARVSMVSPCLSVCDDGRRAANNLRRE